MRQNSNVKSREFVATESSSDEDSTPPAKKTTPNSSTRLPIVSPRQLALAQPTAPANYLSSPTSRSPRTQALRPAAAAAAAVAAATKAATTNPRTKPSLSSSEENSDSSASGSDDHSNNEPVSDKNKNVTLRKLFWMNKSDGGAKGKGQVLIVDSSEDAQQHSQTQAKENAPTEKLLSPYSGSKHAKHASTNPAAGAMSGSNNYNNNNNLLMKGTSAIDLHTLAGKSAPLSTPMVPTSPLICRIDLSRLARIPDGPRRYNSNQFQNDRRTSHRSPGDFAGGRRSRTSICDDDVEGRLSNSRDSSTSSTSSDSRQRDIENGSNSSSRLRYEYDANTVANVSERGKHSSSSGYNSIDSRLGHGEPLPIRNHGLSPKLDEKPMGKAAIKRESLKNEFSNNEYNAYGGEISPPTKGLDDKMHNNHHSHMQPWAGGGGGVGKSYSGNGDTKSIKREGIKMESAYNDGHPPLDPHKLCAPDEFVNNHKKRSSSANSSPYKERKRKKVDDLESQTGPPTNHDRLDAGKLGPPQKPIIQKVYYSYFERTNDERDEVR